MRKSSLKEVTKKLLHFEMKNIKFYLMNSLAYYYIQVFLNLSAFELAFETSWHFPTFRILKYKKSIEKDIINS